MADARPKPKRWRWIIAGILLSLAVVRWWSWPRGDPRFVGTWAIFQGGVRMSTVNLNASGFGKTTMSDGTPYLCYFWSADANGLKLGVESPIGNFLAWLTEGWDSHGLYGFASRGTAYPMQQVSADEFVELDRKTNLPTTTIYRRISD